MSFADILKKNAEEKGHTTIVAEVKTVEKSSDMNAFAANLKRAKALKEIKEEKENEVITEFQPGLVPVWSFSTLKDFESCPYRVKLAKVDKEPQKDSVASERGSLIHDLCENYVRGNTEDLVGDKKTRLEHFEPHFDRLREQFQDGIVSCEENWGIRSDWSPCTWKDKELWGRAKLDAFVKENTSCRIIDYKTGRKFGNEMKHNDQGLSYALHAYYREPEVDFFQVEFWYLDQADTMVKTFTRRQLEVLHPRYHQRAIRMTTATEMLPKPDANSCRFCPYGNNKNRDGVPYGTGICTHDHYRG